MLFVAVAITAAIGQQQSKDDIQQYYFKPNTLRVLILSGRNNHDWRVSTPYLAKVLNDTNRFDVRIEEEPNGITPETLSPYDVLVSDYCGPRWPTVTENAVADFVRSGKGLVIVHAASYPFVGLPVLGANQRRTTVIEPPWEEWKRMVGLYWVDQDGVKTSHGARYTFKLKWKDPEHPILKGLDDYYYATDEFYTKFGQLPDVDINVIATAHDEPSQRGTGKEEPVLITLQYGRGRVFHTILGHDRTALEEPGFAVTFARGAEWAATGQVTLLSPSAQRAQSTLTRRIRCLVATGGAKLDPSFYSVFNDFPGVEAEIAPSSREAFSKDIRADYDVLVLYDRSQALSAFERKHFQEFAEAGKGIVVLHHAIANHPDWLWYRELVGGRYLLKPDGGLSASTTHFGAQVKIVAGSEKSPISSGVVPMHLRTDAFKGMQITADVKILLATDNPNSDRPVAWISPYSKSRVVYLQPGGDRQTFAYPAYQQLIRNAVLWSGGQFGPAR